MGLFLDCQQSDFKKFQYENIDVLILNLKKAGIHSLIKNKLPIGISIKSMDNLENHEDISVSFCKRFKSRKDCASSFFNLMKKSDKLGMLLNIFANHSMNLYKKLMFPLYTGNKYYLNLLNILAKNLDRFLLKYKYIDLILWKVSNDIDFVYLRKIILSEAIIFNKSKNWSIKNEY